MCPWKVAERNSGERTYRATKHGTTSKVTTGKIGKAEPGSKRFGVSRLQRVV
jgi:hypothetical protein